MNHLSLVLSNCSDGDGSEYQGIEILVDGMDFRELVRLKEEVFAAREGKVDLAGSYHWLDVAFTTPAVFLGTAEREYGIDEDKVALMGCSCGVVSCWPLVCRIEVLEDTVVWSEFEQPYRSADSVAGHWDLSELGPFTFKRQNYEAVLMELDKTG